jgi:hypothetical protein
LLAEIKSVNISSKMGTVFSTERKLQNVSKYERNIRKKEMERRQKQQ